VGQKLKICVAGPKCSGKTFLCKLLAEQVCAIDEYQPTAGVRVQELDYSVEGRSMQLQLWDCSGDLNYAKYSPVLCKDANGVVLVYDASKREEQEQEVENFYRLFAQPNGLAISQVLVVSVSKEENGEEVSLQGRLKALPRAHLNLSPPDGKGNYREVSASLLPRLDKLLKATLAKLPQ